MNMKLNCAYIINKHCLNFKMGGINMRTLDFTALTLVIIGAINWGLIGFFEFNLVDALFGTMSWFSRTIYTLVGIAAIYAIAFYDREGQRA